MADVIHSIRRVSNLVGEISAAAEGLKHQAQQLVRSVAVFRLEPGRA